MGSKKAKKRPFLVTVKRTIVETTSLYVEAENKEAAIEEASEVFEENCPKDWTAVSETINYDIGAK